MDKKDYLVKYIPKRNGYRKITCYTNPTGELFLFHKDVNQILLKHTLPSKFAKAYIKNRSIIKNAKSHMFNDIFILLDIKSFFSSIDHKRMINILHKELKRSVKAVSKLECEKIVKSCSVEKKGLAVGFKPSPFLANLYLKEFDNIFYGKLKKIELSNPIYTRYADDLVISFKEHDDKKLKCEEIIEIISDELRRYGLILQNGKTKIININTCNRIKITGVNVVKDNTNRRILTVGRKRKNSLFWEVVKYMKTPEKERSTIIKLRLKGMQSFILSVEGTDYQKSYSENMMKNINAFNFNSLKELIDSF